MPLLTIPTSFTAYTKIKSAEVNGNFTAISDLLNTTKLDSTNVQLNGLTRDRLAKGTADHVVINSADGSMSSEATLATARGGTGVNIASAAPTLGAGALLSEISAPSTPASGKLAVYAKSDHKLYTKDSGGTESQVGSGAPASGVNFIGLTTAWLPQNTTDSDFETSVGNWAAYNDGSVAAPVDMTGGTPVVTIARTTTAGEILNGAASGKLSKDAVNRQGQGISCIANVPAGYTSSKVRIRFPFKVTSGSVADGDLVMYAYDVTNSQLITPFQSSKIVGSQGIAEALFDIQSTTAQLRVGIHVASTSAVAFDVCIDDVQCGPLAAAMAVPVSDPISWTPTGSWVSNATYTGLYQRVGNRMKAQVKIALTGAPTSASLTVNLPSGLTIDTAKLLDTNANNSLSGAKVLLFDTSASNRVDGVIAYNNSTSVAVKYNVSVSAGVAPGTVDAADPWTWATGDTIVLEFDVPISGWSSNVQMAESATFQISSFLANGTRVTGAAPTALGQYRSYLRNAGAATYTETNGTPSTLPTTADGVKIWTASTFASADASGNPSKYEMFVGKNKNVRLSWFSSAGRTGFLDVTPVPAGSSDIGVIANYDPTTGILVVSKFTNGNTNDYIGWSSSSGTGGLTLVGSGYYDVTISENALMVGAQSCRSEVWLLTGNGHGSTNTKIRRFSTTQKNTGTAITYADSAANGASFTINEDGLYSITYVDARASGGYLGISLNSTQLTTGVDTINNTDRLSFQTDGGGTGATNNVTLFLAAGSVIRAHTDGGATSASAMASFRIAKVNL